MITVRERPVTIPIDGTSLPADLTIPAGAHGVVVFAHGSGSSRHSPRNRRVAEALQDAGFATLLMDLLTADEESLDERTHELRFDIPLLAARLLTAVDWIASEEATDGLPIAIFGASTGAAAALIAAAERPDQVRAVVSRGGRPDLAADALSRVAAPTLLIVGERDPTVRSLNEGAAERLTCAVDVVVVPEATHLFEEPGALDAVVEHTISALDRYLAE